jgi:hypothetical protein
MIRGARVADGDFREYVHGIVEFLVSGSRSPGPLNRIVDGQHLGPNLYRFGGWYPLRNLAVIATRLLR